jgi:formate dehydrogenase subunit delta
VRDGDWVRLASRAGETTLRAEITDRVAPGVVKILSEPGPRQSRAGIAEHIRKFWDPRMRKAIFAHLDAGGIGLDPNVRDALETLKRA